MSAVLIPTATEEEWLAARRQGVTASEIAVLMGLSPYDSPYGLYHRKLGIIPQQEQDDAMELGTYMEQFIVGRFGALHPEFSIEGDGRQLFAHPGREWQMATPDRELYEASGNYVGDTPLALLETKIDGGSDEWGEDGTDEIPVHYRAQVLWQMDVMGVDAAYVAALIWHRRKVRVYELAMDDAARADLKLMREEARDFLDRIDARDAPDVDWRPATLDALKTLHPSAEDTGIFVSPQLASRYRAAVRNHKHWEQRKKLYEAQLRQRMGEHRRAHVRSDDPAGEVIARRDVYPVREHVRKASVVDKLVPVYPKKDKNSDRPDSQ
jgi:putative phage-type endonuclease